MEQLDYFAALFVSATLLCCLYCFLLWYRTCEKLPPGAWFNPLGKMFGRTAAESEAKVLGLRNYGDICCLRVLGTPCIYLNSHAKIRQYFIGHAADMSGREDMRGVNHRMSAGRGLIMNDGLSWSEHRRFVLSTLRDFGFGRGGTEQIVLNELLHLKQTFAEHNGLPFDPRLALSMATCNVIGSLVFGERCGSDPGFEALYQMIQTSLYASNDVHDVVTIQILKIITRLPTPFFSDLIKSLDRIQDYLQAKFNEHKSKFNGQVHDLIDGYIKAMQEQTELNYTTFSEVDLYALTADLFVAGTETTANTLVWALLLLVRHPDVQKQVHDELDLVLHGRLPCLSDRKDLVYTDAVLMEVQRFATLTPLGGVHHRCTRTVTIDNYLIPKNSLLHANFYAAHRDESVWPDPYNFNPHNFYKQSSKSLQNAEYLIPFGVGKRSCLGESLAKQELFLFLAGVLQKFEIVARCTDIEKFPSPEEATFGNARLPPAYEIIAKARC